MNAHPETFSLASMRLLAAGFKDTPIEIRALVPRFTAAPAGLDACFGFSYDPDSKLLRVGHKKVAYLSTKQPRLTLPVGQVARSTSGQ